MNPDGFELRAYVHIDRMQPQFAAFVGAITEGDPPVEGMASLYVEMLPGNTVFKLVDTVVKGSNVRPGMQMVEREFGIFEVHAPSQADVLRAGDITLEELNASISDRIKPEIVSSQVVTNVSPYQAQLLNRANQGTMIVAGQTMLVMEVVPATYITLAANEAEKAAPIFLNHVSSVGRYGRLWMAGTESDILAAKDAATNAIESVSGV